MPRITRYKDTQWRKVFRFEDYFLGQYNCGDHVLSQKQIEIMVRRISSHFNIPMPEINYTWERYSQAQGGYLIVMSEKTMTSMYVLHELSHVLHWWLAIHNLIWAREPGWGHDGCFMAILIILYHLQFKELPGDLIRHALKHDIEVHPITDMQLAIAQLKVINPKENHSRDLFRLSEKESNIDPNRKKGVLEKRWELLETQSSS